MNESTPLDRFRENATEIVSVLVTGIWLAALLTGQSWWLGALLFGYIVVVPIARLLFGDEEDTENDGTDGTLRDRTEYERTTSRSSRGDRVTNPSSDPSETPLQVLRRRYAEGELSDEQFERKLERLLENETLEDVEDAAARERARLANTRERDRTYEE